MRFLYVGQIRAEKGVNHLLAAAELLFREGRDFKISIAGRLRDGTSEQNCFADSLIQRVEAHPDLKATVNFLGHVEDIDAAFATHDVHVAPSICEESYGLVVVEAKHNRRASIIFPSGGMVELIEHGRDGLICDEQTPASLASAMRTFLENESFAVTMGSNAQASLARLGLSRDAFQERWRNVLEGLLSKRPATRSKSHHKAGGRT